MHDDPWDALAERSRQTTRTNPPARLGDVTEATYRRHISMRAAAMGVTETNLAHAIEWASLIRGIANDEVA